MKENSYVSVQEMNNFENINRRNHPEKNYPEINYLDINNPEKHFLKNNRTVYSKLYDKSNNKPNQNFTTHSLKQFLYRLYRISTSISLLSNIYLSIFYYKSKNFRAFYFITFTYILLSVFCSLQVLEFQKFIEIFTANYSQPNVSQPNSFKTKPTFYHFTKTTFHFFITPRFNSNLLLTYNTLPIIRDFIVIFTIFQNNSDILKKVIFEDFILETTDLSTVDFYDDLLSNIAFFMLCFYLVEILFYVVYAAYKIFK